MRQKKMVQFCSVLLSALSLVKVEAAEQNDKSISNVDEDWAIHGQFTNVTQKHASFRSPYSGQNSLDAKGRAEETTDITIYAGVRLWRNAEFWLNPEIDQGFGLSNTVGLAGFSSGEAYKVGANSAYLRLPRAFLRQTFALNGETENIEPAANQLGGKRVSNNVVVTVGKFSVVDLFDTNTYAHDPRTDFLNWSVIDAGAFDYAADAWGFTYGAAVEWNQNAWTARAGVFQLSPVPNAKVAGLHFKQYSLVGELESRFQLGEHPGKLKLLGFINRAPMGNYADAVQASITNGGVPDIAQVRRKGTRAGASLNFEQEVAKEIGIFARASFNDGDKEAYEFTEINKSISSGIAIKGANWGRSEDTFGLATVFNGLSSQAKRYFALGGIGILIGDGNQRYGAEKILETYYSAKIVTGVTLTLNFQHVTNPAYNKDRGPVSIYAARVHAEF